MKKIETYSALDKFGRIRLSKNFFMRDFLYSEISNFYGIPNLPDNPDLAIECYIWSYSDPICIQINSSKQYWE